MHDHAIACLTYDLIFFAIFRILHVYGQLFMVVHHYAWNSESKFFIVYFLYIVMPPDARACKSIQDYVRAHLPEILSHMNLCTSMHDHVKFCSIPKIYSFGNFSICAQLCMKTYEHAFTCM